MRRSDPNSATDRDWQRVHQVGGDPDAEAQGLMRWASYGAGVLLASLAGAAILAFSPYFVRIYDEESTISRAEQRRQYEVQRDIARNDSGSSFLTRVGAGAGIGAVVAAVIMVSAARGSKRKE